MLKYVVFCCFLTLGYASFANEIGLKDTLPENDTSYHHIPKRAAIFSAIIPGAGQIYNEMGFRKIPQKKHQAWWKVPIIYGGLAACGYYYYYNNQFANLTRQEWQFREQNAGVLDQRFANYTSDQLIAGVEVDGKTVFEGYDKFANRRDIFAFAFLAVWGLNVVEAYVNAHFVTFDVSEDLSLSWSPTLIGYQHPGLGLRLNFN